ncbi:MAG: hypothetical protein KIT58_03540 [Planctomycetota bacterium]|nr:hypothetical protein [Planctomycetota bacterium]
MTGLLWIAEGDAVCRADGRSIRLEQLGVREFNFGQHWRTPGVRNVEYETVLPLCLAEDFLSRQLPDFVRDSQEHPDDHPLEVALRAAGWPGAREVLGTPALASPALEFFGHDLLLAWAGWSPAEGVGFIANTIDAIEVWGGCVTLRGKARPAEPPTPGTRFAYQDS